MGTPWCYVDKSCKSVGWDACRDAQTLLAAAVTEKADVEKQEAQLQAQLDTTKAQLKDAEMRSSSLSEKLKATESTSSGTIKQEKEKEQATEAKLKSVEM